MMSTKSPCRQSFKTYLKHAVICSYFDKSVVSSTKTEKNFASCTLSSILVLLFFLHAVEMRSTYLEKRATIAIGLDRPPIVRKMFQLQLCFQALELYTIPVLKLIEI